MSYDDLCGQLAMSYDDLCGQLAMSYDDLSGPVWIHALYPLSPSLSLSISLQSSIYCILHT